MTRGRLSLALSLLVVASATGAFLLRSGTGVARPHVVLVVWDTCRGDRVSVHGYAHPTTPRLAELAAGGVTYRNCFSPSPWTPPAHGSLFTGLLPRNHGLREGRGDRIGEGVPLLAETLSRAGYETVAVVANPHLSEVTGLTRGFGTVLECWDHEEGTPGSAREVRLRVDAWLEGRKADGRTGPLFLFVNLMETHLPYAHEDGVVSAVRGDGAANGARRAALAVTPESAVDHFHGINPVEGELLEGLDAAYDGAVWLADRATGWILDALRADGLLANAFVAVTGDHGESLGEHGEIGHFLSLYDTVLHVPLVISWPGGWGAGRVEDSQVRLQDLHPTILEVAGVRPPEGTALDARTLREHPLRSRTLVAEYGPLEDILEEARVRAPGASLLVIQRLQQSLLAVREREEAGPEWKFIGSTFHPPDGEPSPAGEQVFDLRADPGETRNLLLGTPSREVRTVHEVLKARGR